MFRAESRLLETMGHTVHRHAVHNDAVEDLSRAALLRRTLWSRETYRAVADLVQDAQIDVVHFHNTLPLVSPSAYYAARKHGAAVVQSLHNYRLHCPGALYFREGRVCEDCLGKSYAWSGIRHGCYRGSRAATAAVATMTAAHRQLGTWDRAVDRYIAMTDFAHAKFIEGGLPADKLAVKPNFLDPDPGAGTGQGGYALFVGRLSHEKGISLILDAWTRHAPDLRLVIAGDGPEAAAVEAAVAAHPDRIEWVGHQTRDGVMRLMADAAVFVFSSECYEGGTPMALIEAMANGTPVVASDLGGPKSMVKQDVAGTRFAPGDPAALAAAVNRLAADPARLQALRASTRALFEHRYTAAANYALLVDIYDAALRQRHDGPGVGETEEGR
ncbi:MAG: glycosyltransferase family 4 protein [Bacteroidota bacterium]